MTLGSHQMIISLIIAKYVGAGGLFTGLVELFWSRGLNSPHLAYSLK